MRRQEQLEAWLITLGLIIAIGKVPPYPASKTSSATTPADSSKSRDSSQSVVTLVTKSKPIKEK